MTLEQFTYKERGIKSFNSPAHNLLMREGRAFQAGVIYKDVSEGDKVQLFVENPSDSGYDFEFVVALRASALCDVEWSGGATEDTQGSDAVIANLRMDNPISFVGNIRHTTTGNTGSYSHNNDKAKDFIPAGEKGTKLGASMTTGVTARLIPNSNGLIDVISRGTPTSRIMAKVAIYMVDISKGYFPRTTGG